MLTINSCATQQNNIQLDMKTITIDTLPEIQFELDEHYPAAKLDTAPKWNGIYSKAGYTLSVGYGGSMYGSAPSADCYEIALINPPGDFVNLHDHDYSSKVIGWVSSELIRDITKIMDDSDDGDSLVRGVRDRIQDKIPNETW